MSKNTNIQPRSLDEEYNITFKDAEEKYQNYLKLYSFDFKQITSNPDTTDQSKKGINWDRSLSISFKSSE